MVDHVSLTFRTGCGLLAHLNGAQSANPQQIFQSPPQCFDGVYVRFGPQSQDKERAALAGGAHGGSFSSAIAATAASQRSSGCCRRCAASRATRFAGHFYVLVFDIFEDFRDDLFDALRQQELLLFAGCAVEPQISPLRGIAAPVKNGFGASFEAELADSRIAR